MTLMRRSIGHWLVVCGVNGRKQGENLLSIQQNCSRPCSLLHHVLYGYKSTLRWQQLPTICGATYPSSWHRSRGGGEMEVRAGTGICVLLERNTGCFLTGAPQFQYQKENLPSSQSRPILVSGLTGTAPLIGWLAVFFLVLKLGSTS